MQADELDFELPSELIAQTPAAHRAESQLLHYVRSDRSVEHRRFSDLPSLLRRGDLLVLNDAQVIPARFALKKNTGGIVDALYLADESEGRWRVMLRNAGPNAAGRVLHLADAPDVKAVIVEDHGGGQYTIRLEPPQKPLDLLGRVGRMPLPPYIHRRRQHDALDDMDRRRYQTVYAQSAGSVAAPTAGLHFTDELFAALEAAGIERTFVTLHVGLGTFKPVTAPTLEAHEMHREAYSISAAAADALNRAKVAGRRIVAVGTTAARVLESQPADAPFVARRDETGIFIYPPYRWRHAGALITNFHLPRSTLIALVAAFMGLEEQRRTYRIAIDNRYRFFSYGDAMLIE